MRRLSEPFSVPEPLADEWDDMIRRNRQLQAKNDPTFDDGRAPEAPEDGYATDLNDPDLPIDVWQQLRKQQLAAAHALVPSDPDASRQDRGADIPGGNPGPRPVMPVAAARRGLTGRSGAAEMVAGAINTMAASTNSRTTIPSSVGPITVSRGPGQQVDAGGRAKIRVKGVPISTSVPFGVSGQLDAASTQPGVSFSKVAGHVGIGGFESFPNHLRVFNTPTGELDYEFCPDIRYSAPGGLFRWSYPAGTYVIGAPDRLRGKKRWFFICSCPSTWRSARA
jgi:hypothetical protein